MIIKNCNIIYLDRIVKGSVLVEDSKIKQINPSDETGNEIIDAKGLYLSPGFIDVHIHGAGGYDTMEGTIDSLNEISKTIVKHGTTSFVPTTMTMDSHKINLALSAISKAKKKGTEGAEVLGAHLEGPFINPKAIGAQNPEYLISPSIENYKEMTKDYEDIVLSITLAPEISGAKDLIEYLSKKGIVCSAGHTKASYTEIIESIKVGLSHSTHFFNAMTPLNHREPGTVGAILDSSNITTETIADGIHVSYPALRITYKQKGTDNVLLVSDAMEACGMPNGNYSLGCQKVIVKDGVARVETGSLAGSVLTLDKAVHNIYKNTEIPLYEIVKMASYNGAKHCKIGDHKGLIKEGYDADLLLFDDNIDIKKVFVGGKVRYSKEI